MLRRAASLAGCILLLAAGMTRGATKTGSPEDSGGVDASSATFHPNSHLNFAVERVTTAFHVDGRLDEPAWKTATRIDNFSEVEPGDNTRPPVDTEAWLAYDEENLYIAFVCYDDNPSAIRASVADRDNIYQDDWAGIAMDTFQDQQNGYFFVVNPRGIQGDIYRSGNNEDTSYDAVWYSGGQLTDFGWTAEVAIPFRSIRFPDGPVQEWNVHFFRTRPRESRAQYSWAPLSRDANCFFCQAGNMNGISGINQGRNIEVLPYVLGSQSGSLSGEDDPSFAWNNAPGEAEAGVGLKYGITPNHTLDLTYNPDFSQIEADATQIDANQTFALFYPEKRPFFLEGADRFASLIDVVYTRSINDPIAAGKYTGKSGPNTLTFMTAKDETSPYIVPFEEQSGGAAGGNTYSNVLRYKRDILTESFVGVIATDRRAAEGNGSNTTAGIDMRLRLSEHFRLSAQMQASDTHEPNDTTMSSEFNDITFGTNGEHTGAFDGESYTGHAGEMSLVRSGRHYNAELNYSDYSPTFRAENGFITSNNYRLANFWNGYQFQIENNPVFERIEPQLTAGRKYNYAGEFKDTWVEPGVWMRFKKQTYLYTGYLWSEEVFAGRLVSGIARWYVDIDTRFSNMIGGGVDWRLGPSVIRDRDNPRLGDQFSYGIWLEIKPTSQLLFSLEHATFHISELDGGPDVADTFVSRGRMTYQFSKRLFMRLVGEYVDDTRAFSVDPLVSYKINPFTVFFVGSSHSFGEFKDDPATSDIEVRDGGYRQTERLFFVKFQYLFRV
ncbi:MAG TPA: DUF5916 domain-containing protein [Candidatus Krumholzibacteria bacterium]|nr:DUF5916 domain-containing protein [Candidatus Krumholzibacteria bacterium]